MDHSNSSEECMVNAGQQAMAPREGNPDGTNSTNLICHCSSNEQVHVLLFVIETGQMEYDFLLVLWHHVRWLVTWLWLDAMMGKETNQKTKL